MAAPHSKNPTNDLFDAYSRRDSKAMAEAVAAGADIDAFGVSGMTLLQSAVWTRDTYAIDTLLALGANTGIRMPKDGRTALHLAVEQQSTAALRKLLAHGADAGIPDHKGNTPLHDAVDVFDVPAIRLLLAGGAPLDVKNNAGLTPAAAATDEAMRLPPGAVMINLLEIAEMIETEAARRKSAAAQAEIDRAQKTIRALRRHPPKKLHRGGKNNPPRP